MTSVTKGLHFLSQVARATFLVSVFTPICLKIAQLTKRMKAAVWHGLLLHDDER